MISRPVIAGVAALLLTGGCTDPTSPEEALTAAQARWNGAAVSDYAFDLQRSCFCAPVVTRPVTITVAGGQFVSAVYADSGTLADTALFRDYLTVPRLFDLVQRSLDAKPDSAAISYDPAIGYPVQVWIDVSHSMADEEHGFEVLALRHPRR